MSSNVQNNNTPDDPSQEIQAYIDAIEAQYAVAENYINAMEHDSTRIGHDQTKISKLIPQETYVTYTYDRGVPITHHHTNTAVVHEVTQLQADETARNNDIATQKAALEKLDPSFAAYDNTLSAFLATVDQAIKNGDSGGGRISQDVQKVQALLQQMFKGMRDKLQVDMDTAIIENDQDGNLTDAQLEQLAQQMYQSSTAEEIDLAQLQTMVQKDVTMYYAIGGDAATDKARYSKLDEWFGNADAAEAEDDLISDNATVMIQGLSGAWGDLAPEMAAAQPEFVEISVLADIEKKKMEALIAEIGSNPGLQLGSILALAMFALSSVFNRTGQQSQESKANNQKNLSQGNLIAAQTNIQKMQINQKIQEEEKANAELMKTVMFAAQITVGILGSAIAPGIGTALLMGLFTALEATGQLDQLTSAIASGLGCSSLEAELLVGALEIALTCGGGAAGDLALSKATEESVTVAASAAQTSLEDAVNTAAANAVSAAKITVEKSGQAAYDTALTNAKAVIEKTVKEATEKAAQRTVEQLANQPVAALLKFLAQSGREAAKASIEQAATEAGQLAIDNSATIAKLAARGIQSTNAITTDIATQAANKAAADVAGVTEGTVAKSSRSNGAKAFSRAAWTAAFNATSSDYLIQMCEAIQKARGKGNDQSFDNFLIFMQVVRQIMQALVLAGGTGMMSGTPFNGSVGTFIRYANLVSMIPQGASAAASYGLATTQTAQGKTVTALAENQIISDLLHTYIDQMQKDANLSTQRFISQQQQEQRNVSSLAGHLQDGDAVGIQVLMAGVS